MSKKKETIKDIEQKISVLEKRKEEENKMESIHEQIGRKVEITSFDSNLSMKVKVIDLGNGISLTKSTFKMTGSDELKKYKPKDEQFFTPNSFVIIPKQYVKDVRLYGWTCWGSIEKQKEYKEIFIKTTFDFLTKNPNWQEEYVLVNFNTSNHTWKDIEGNQLPVGQGFDYINAKITSRYYDIVKLKEYLETREDIFIYEDINEIPEYNRKMIGETTISFIWQPLVEDYIKIDWELGSYERNKIMLNLIGTNKFKYETPLPYDSEDD